MKRKTKPSANAKPVKLGDKNFTSLEQITKYFFPGEEPDKCLTNGDELGTEVAQKVLAKLFDAE